MKKTFFGIMAIIGLASLTPFCVSTALAKTMTQPVLTEDHLRPFKDSERRAVAIANWWKHKFKDEPAFSGPVIMTPGFNTAMPVTALRQNAIEEEAR